MQQIIRVREANSGLDARFSLLSGLAPHSSAALWQIAGERSAGYDAIHAMWTGPEISCPIPVEKLPASVDPAALPLENATSYPAAGDLVLVPMPTARWKGLGGAMIDLGFFYGDGARLLMPIGWIMGSVCARVLDADLKSYQAGCIAIRRAGVCKLSLSREE